MSDRTLDQWLAWLEAGWTARIELGLERVSRVLHRLGHERPPWTVVTVAGTNGKGSCVALLEATLAAAGYRVGAYTSPHILRYNERVRVDRHPIASESLCEAFSRVDEARGGLPLTYFEFGTLAAIDHFARVAPDVVLLEVGLGGRLDACNVLDADVALITRIGLDHQEWLGTDRDSVAVEKAGVLRSRRPAVCGDPDPPAAVAAEAARIGAPLYQSGSDFHFHAEPPGWNWRCASRRRRALPLPSLPGAHQVANAAAALMVLELLHERLPVGQGAVRTGLMEVELPGRFQVIPGTVELILDVAHNVQAAGSLAELLRRRPCDGETHVLLAMLEDKDTAGFVTELRDVVDHWHVAGLPVPRGLSAEALNARMQAAGHAARSVSDTVSAGLEQVQGIVGPGDRILVCGSFYTVAEVARRHV